jgi:hypothetical protein
VKGDAFVKALREEMQQRYVRWDDELWQWTLAQPGKRLATQLISTGGQEEGRRVLEAYLRLVASGIGEGYLFPAQSVGVQSVFHHLFFEVLPTQLPHLDPQTRLSTLAQVWNLGENLEKGPTWLAQVFWHCRSELAQLDDLQHVVDTISQQVVTPLKAPLEQAHRVFWLDLAMDDARFFPGHIVVRSPRILQVLDRERHAAGITQSSIGIWLRDEPVVLGPMGSLPTPEKRKSRVKGALKLAARQDSRITLPFDLVVEETFAGATLKSSQFLVVLLGSEK